MINSVIFVTKIKTRTRIIGRRFKKRERKLWRPRKLKRNKNYNLGKENERKRELSQQLILILILVQEIQLCANCIMQLWSEMRQPIATDVAWYVCVCVCLSVCWSQPWVLRKRMKRSRCHLIYWGAERKKRELNFGKYGKQNNIKTKIIQ